jgi:hypothetical protein
VYVLVFAAAVLTVLYQLADFAFLPRVVTSERLLDANSKLTATQSAAEIGGKGLDGLLVQALTAPFAVLFNAAGYLVGAPWGIRFHDQIRRDPPPVDED